MFNEKIMPTTIKGRLEKLINDKAWTPTMIGGAIDVHVAVGNLTEIEGQELFALLSPIEEAPEE